LEEKERKKIPKSQVDKRALLRLCQSTQLKAQTSFLGFLAFSVMQDLRKHVPFAAFCLLKKKRYALEAKLHQELNTSQVPVAHACNPKLLRRQRSGGLRFKASPRQIVL
jgi:hypothetical protein